MCVSSAKYGATRILKFKLETEGFTAAAVRSVVYGGNFWHADGLAGSSIICLLFSLPRPKSPWYL